MINSIKFSKKTILTICILLLTLGSIFTISNALTYLTGEGVLANTSNQNQILAGFVFLIGYLPSLGHNNAILFEKIISSFFNHDFHSKSYIFLGINLFMWFTLFIGTIQFYNNDKTRLLRFIFSVIFIEYFTGLIYVSLNFFLDMNSLMYGGLRLQSEIPLYLKLFYFLRIAIFTALFYLLISQLSRDFENHNGTFVETSKSRRIFGRLIEIILIIIFGWKFSDYFLIMMRSFYAGESSILQNETIGLTLYNAFGTFFYYLIFEGFFKTTPAKILMGTKVLYTNREVPSFGDIFRRTVCRFIPIEGLFFILNHRWHDTFSETSVYDIEV